MVLLISHRFMHENGDSLSSTLFIFSLLILNIGLAYFGIRFENNELYNCDLLLKSVSKERPSSEVINDEIKTTETE